MIQPLLFHLILEGVDCLVQLLLELRDERLGHPNENDADCSEIEKG